MTDNPSAKDHYEAIRSGKAVAKAPDAAIIAADVRYLLAAVESGTPLLIQASGAPTLTIHDPAVSAKIIGILMDHLKEPS